MDSKSEALTTSAHDDPGESCEHRHCCVFCPLFLSLPRAEAQPIAPIRSRLYRIIASPFFGAEGNQVSKNQQGVRPDRNHRFVCSFSRRMHAETRPPGGSHGGHCRVYPADSRGRLQQSRYRQMGSPASCSSSRHLYFQPTSSVILLLLASSIRRCPRPSTSE